MGSQLFQFHLPGGKGQHQQDDIQAVEAHRLSLLNEVFQRAERQKHPMTESCCTMLLYNLGYDINFIESSVNNIKLTREEDIAAFSALVKA